MSVMKEILKAKFQDKFLALLLLSTDGIDLVEVNTWNDRFWGICHGRGENQLGKLLMELREELKEDYANTNDGIMFAAMPLIAPKPSDEYIDMVSKCLLDFVNPL